MFQKAIKNHIIDFIFSKLHIIHINVCVWIYTHKLHEFKLPGLELIPGRAIEYLANSINTLDKLPVELFRGV